MKEGPSIEELTRHLAECPESFLAEPIQARGKGTVHVAAVVSDLSTLLGGDALTPKQVKKFSYGSKKNQAKDRNRLRLVLVCCWLAYAESLRRLGGPEKLLVFLSELGELAGLMPAEQFVVDEERREELVRLLMNGLSLLPKGEKKEEAENRLEALSTVKRDAVVKAARAAEQRARKLREELARKERERRAASVWSHE